MNSLNKLLGECAEKLENRYGVLRNSFPLNSAWTSDVRKPPVFMQYDGGELVLHRTDDTINLKKFNQLLRLKNNSETISTIAVYISENFFVTNYIQGTTLDKKPSLTTIEDIARLQYKFNMYNEKLDLNCWLEHLNRAKSMLYERELIQKSDLPALEFQHFGLIHGDYDRKNIVHSEGKNIIIDIEHVMYGPIAYDLARPLKRICKTEEDKNKYIQAYDSKMNLSKDELCYGIITFYLIQAFNRARWGYMQEAVSSIKSLEVELVNKK